MHHFHGLVLKAYAAQVTEHGPLQASGATRVMVNS